MWAAFIGLAASVIPAILKLFGGGGNDQATKDARELGRDEQQLADMKGGMDTVRRATEAAKKAEEPTDEPDANDRDAGR